MRFDYFTKPSVDTEKFVCRIVYAIVAVIVILTLTACGGGSDGSEEDLAKHMAEKEILSSDPIIVPPGPVVENDKVSRPEFCSIPGACI